MMMPLLVSIVSFFFVPVLNVFHSSCALFVLSIISILCYSGETSYQLGMESNLSFPLVILVLWVGAMSLLVMPIQPSFSKWYSKSIYFLLLFLLFSFFSLNGVIFYIFFEACLVPISYLIIFWGHSPERVESVYYMIIYTFLGGSVHMTSLVMMDLLFYTTSFLSGMGVVLESRSTILFKVWWFCLVLPFLIKSPCYGFHLWLPKAHVEAPASGSMLLAAVLLKLGLYGVFRYSMMVYPPLSVVLIIQSFGIFGGVICSFVAIRQVDVKSVIAYSSVSHMSFSLSALLTFSDLAWQGVLVMAVAHGVSSSGLFAWVGVVYQKIGTRNILLLSGLRSYSSGQAGVMLALLMSNMGMPPFFSFWGEYFVFSSLFFFCPLLFLVLMLSMTLSMVYSIYLFICVQHSHLGPSLSKAKPINFREWLVLFFHLVLLLGGFFFPWFGV